jgi:glycosyltransferase involved in cell wall biosynthesis
MKDLILESFGIPAERIRVIPHAVRDDYFRVPTDEDRVAARQALSLDSNDFVVSLVGRLDVGMKRHDLLIEAVRRLREDGIPAVTVLAGVGAGEQTIRGLAAAKRLNSHVRLIGYHDAREVFWASDTLALPSHGEAFGIVVAEAMCCGVVPVRTVGPGARDQIEDGKTGFIIPYNDADALTDRLRQLYRDPVRRQEMSEGAVARASQRFTASRMVSDTLALYEELWAGRQRRHKV